MAVGSDQRFTKESPCPVCGGYDEAPRGRGLRCWGFLSSDGKTANCTNGVRAGDLTINPRSETYAHRLAAPSPVTAGEYVASGGLHCSISP